MKWWNNFSITRHHFVLLILLLIIIGNLIYIYPKLGDSPVPSKWSVGIDWGRHTILDTGHIYTNNDETALTWQSNIINYGSVDLLPKIYFAIINLVTGTVTFPDDLKFHHAFPWVGTLLLPIIIMYFYKYVSKEESRDISYLDCSLLFLFVMFPLASSLDPVSGNTNGSGIARALFTFILSILLIIFNEKKKNSLNVLLFIVLLISFFNYYHTWIYYLLIYLISILIISAFRKNERYIASLAILGIVLFFSTAIYYNFQILQEPLTLIKFFPQILENFPSVLYTAKVNSEYLGYQTFNSMYSYLQVINSILIMGISMIYFYTYVKQKNPKSYENILFYYLIAQAGIGVGLFIWDGVLGIYSRIFESLVYITMLFSAYLLIKSDNRLKNVIRCMLLLAAIITVFSYLSPPVESNWQLTDEEFIGIKFAGEQIPNDSYIFADFRLGTPLIYFNQLGIVTIDSLYNLPNVTDEILLKCYYRVSEPETILDEVINSDSYFFMTSFHQTEVYLIDPSLTRFKQANINYQEKWSHERAFCKIYSSEYVEIFARNE